MRALVAEEALLLKLHRAGPTQSSSAPAEWRLGRAHRKRGAPRAALVGNRRSDQSERRDILVQMPWLREIGQWHPTPIDLAATRRAFEDACGQQWRAGGYG
jgi:hypothetical protein